MRIHYLQHVPFEGLGSMQAYFSECGYPVSVTRQHLGEQLPDVDELDWLIIMGGPMGVGDSDEYDWLTEECSFIRSSIDAGKVVLGICLGAQLIATALGGEVTRNACPEIGWFPVTPSEDADRTLIGDLFDSAPEVFHWHGDTFSLPAGTSQLLESEACKNQAFTLDNRVVGLQFHLETTPDSARALIDNCGKALEASRFVQTPDEIMGTQKKFEGINTRMRAILHRIEELNR